MNLLKKSLMVFAFGLAAIQALRPDQSELNTPFESSLGDAGKLILQGIEADRGWTAAVSPETGRVVVAVAGEDVSFSLFAACTPKP